MDSIEIVEQDSSLRPVIRGDSLKLRLKITMNGAVGELACSPVMEKPQLEQYNRRLVESVERNMEELLDLLQRQRADVIGIGDLVYRTRPGLWRRWKPDWAGRFARCTFAIKVDVKVLNTGITVGEPFSYVK